MDEPSRISIDVSDDLAEAVRAHVASGRFDSESEVVAAGLALLEDRDQDDQLDEWLRMEIAERCGRVDTGETGLLTPKQVRERLEQHRVSAAR